jgi:hypothetical protein
MYGLGMLTEVIESRESARAVALKGAFTSVFSDVSSKMLTSSEAELARRIFRTIESLGFLLLGSCAIVIDALVFGSLFSFFFSLVVHVHILRLSGLGRVLRVAAVQGCLLGLVVRWDSHRGWKG